MLEPNNMSDGPMAVAVVPFKYKYCRMCAWELKQGVLIFGEEGKRLQLAEKIRRSLSIMIFEEDNLPKKICTDCCASLEDYSLFKGTVLEAQEKLANIARLQENRDRELQFHYAISEYPSPSSSEDRKVFLNLDRNRQQQQQQVAQSPQVASGSTSTSMPKAERSGSVSSSNPKYTCVECGKRFAIRLDFEEHMSTVHNMKREGQRKSKQTNKTQPQSVADIKSPPSPTGSVTSVAAQSQFSEPELIDLDEEMKEKEPMDKKVGVVPGTSTNSKNDNDNGQSQGQTQIQETNSSEDSDDDEDDDDVDDDETDSNSNSMQKYQCRYCDKILLSRAGLCVHIKTHGGRTFDCPECGKSYTQKNNLNLHIGAHHPELAASMEIKQPDTPTRFQCDQCQKDFARKSNLNQHLKCHMEERLFECNVCNKRYRTNKCLQKHKEYHSEVTFDCSFCDKKFVRKTKLAEHEYTHTDARPYGCSSCKLAFNSQPTYVRHYKRKHKAEVTKSGGKVPPHIWLGPEKKNQVKKVEPESPAQPETQQQQKIPVAAAVAASTSATPAVTPADTPEPYNCAAMAALAPPDPAESPQWVDLTGKQPVQQQQQQQQQQPPQHTPQSLHSHLQQAHVHITQSLQFQHTPVTTPDPGHNHHAYSHLQQQPQPVAMNLNINSNLQEQQQQQQQHQHLQIPIPQHSHPTMQQYSHPHTLHYQQQQPHSSGQLNQMHPYQHLMSHNHNQQQLSHPQQLTPHSQHQQQSSHMNSHHSQSHSQSQSQSQGLSLTSAHTQAGQYQHQPSGLGPGPSNSHLYQQQHQPPTSQQQQHQPGTSQQQQQQQPQHSSGHGYSHHSSSIAHSSHGLLQIQPSLSHYSNLNLAPLGLGMGMSYQSPYNSSSSSSSNNNGNNHNHPLPLGSLDLMDCAIQSAFSNNATDPGIPAASSSGPLSYKLDSSANSAFQEMPMELTKVFQSQSGPLELCVRNDFNQLMDLTAKESNFNERMNIMDFRQQPMDLISRNEVGVSGSSSMSQQHPQPQPQQGHSQAQDNNNLVDLSLRSSFQDQSENSFLRELIDLSSRSDCHGELNLSSRGPLSQTHSHGHNNHSQGHGHSGGHRGNSLQNVVYSDAMFSLQQN